MYGLDNTEIMGLGNAPTQVNHPALSGTSRNEAMVFIAAEMPHIADLLNKGKLKLQDSELYATAVVTGRGETIKFFEQKHAKEIGVRNVHQARLEKGRIFVISQVQLLAAIVYVEGANPQDHEILTAAAESAIWRPIDYVKKYTEVALAYKDTNGKLALAFEGDSLGSLDIGTQALLTSQTNELELFPGAENGELTLEINKKKLIEELPLNAFKYNQGSYLPEGTIKLDNPRGIQDDTDIKAEIYLPAEIDDSHLVNDGSAGAEYIVFKLIFKGTATVPA